MTLMAKAPGMRFELIKGSWVQQMEHVYRLNGIDPARVITLPLLPQERMAEIYRESDIGLFPNRCEGGTNLVLMEYMACGRPVIVTDATGHRDVVNEKNAFLLRQLRELNINGLENQIAARWHEASVDEIIAQIEYAYNHRAESIELGRKAAEDMTRWTWRRTAETVVSNRAAGR
jgi:glycosyltransferase involved in cell wall biosynthesis